MRLQFLFFLCILSLALAAKPLTPELRCSACRTVSKMIRDRLALLPDRAVNIGWRIDSKGNRVTKKVPYNKSNEGVSEVLDELCDNLGSYGIFTNSKGIKSFKSLSGGSISGSFSIDGDSSAGFARECRRISEGFEAEISDMVFNDKYLDEALCVDLLRVCEAQNVVDEL
ncbi:hypothetical protein RCL1_005527 [Eukaryota sp. TZLM3-RCL]